MMSNAINITFPPSLESSPQIMNLGATQISGLLLVRATLKIIVFDGSWILMVSKKSIQTDFKYLQFLIDTDSLGLILID